MTWSLLPWITLALVPLAGLASAQQAEQPVGPVSDLRVRAAVGGALLVSPDQTGVLGFKGTGMELEGQVGYAALPWLEPHAALLTGIFPADGGGPGGLLAPLAGVRVGLSGRTHPVYGSFDVGPGFTGTRVRPYFRVSGGADFRISRWLTLGPRLGYFHLLRVREPNATSGARGLDLALCLSFHQAQLPPPEREPAPPPVIIKREKVVEHQAPPPEPPPSPPPAEPSEEILRLIEQAVPASRQELIAPVLFRFDSDVLEPVGIAMLHEVRAVLERRPDLQLLEIQGYADTRGAAEYNEALSIRRAERVRSWLVGHGVDPERLTVAGHGASAPVEPGSAEADHHQNRRVVFRVLRTASP